jgi:hypothetical protein
LVLGLCVNRISAKPTIENTMSPRRAKTAYFWRI